MTYNAWKVWASPPPLTLQAPSTPNPTQLRIELLPINDI